MSEPTFRKEHEDKFFLRHVQELAGNQHFACDECGAPGIYTADERIKTEFPSCYNERLVNIGVGPFCPHCNAIRTRPPERVVSKRREWWVFRLPDWATRITTYWDRRNSNGI